MGPLKYRSQSGTSHAGHGLDKTASPERPALQWRLAGDVWSRLRQWVRANTFAPSWLPARLRHPALGYLAAVMLGVIAVALKEFLRVVMPASSLLGVLVILGVVLVALSWGGSPGLLATLVSAALLSYAAFSSPFSWSVASVEAAVCVGTVLAVGLLISLVVGRVARRSQARQEAEMQARVLRETQMQMETFLAIAGHELKTPLTYIKLSLQWMQRRLEKLVRTSSQTPEEFRQKVTAMLQEFAHTDQQVALVERLVNDMLDVSCIRAGRLELHYESADLGMIVCQAVNQQRQVAPRRTLLLQLPQAQPVPVYADADRLAQVVTNYLTNALKYSPIEQPILVGLDVVDHQGRVWVRDQGPGLPQEEQARIWESFHRVQGIEAQSGNGDGLGLGLHICRSIIEHHQGQVGVESAPGQ
ncbi:MAG TPA: HAMP domain-containing sensor histidine kinase, partial [Ktedonobacteraceae bacterium]|nr:HAMP domain-containing sensor histidine kinase [Ktedonobacteraceae bacterium]